MCVLQLIRVLILTCAALSIATVQSAGFLGLGTLPGGWSSEAWGVSADGAVVVGGGSSNIGFSAIRWTETGGMESLGFLPSGDSSRATGVSADGSVVVGWGYGYPASGSPQAIRWTEASGMEGLGFLPSGKWSFAYGVSADGSVVVGQGGSDPGINRAFRWTEADGMESLGTLHGGSWSVANDVSADGSLVVGASGSETGTQAFRCTEAGGMEGLGFLPGGTWSVANDVSADGSLVVGGSGSETGNQAFRWTEAGGMEGLGALPGSTHSWANAVSADGIVIVGGSGVQAFRWTEAHGMESIPKLLSSSGIDLTDWTLKEAYDANGDGSIIVGTGRSASAYSEAWIADLVDVLPLVDLSGTIKTSDGLDICAVVLASGEFTFSCNPPGEFTLINLQRDNNGPVKRQIYADGFYPKIDIITEDTDEAVVMTKLDTCPGYNTPYDPGYYPDTAGNRIDISGNVLLQDTQTPICAMVLANGQVMFSCDGTGSYDLSIPLDTNGQFKLQVYADNFTPAIQKIDEFSPVNDVRMTHATECQ